MEREELLNKLKKAGYLKSQRLIKAFKEVPREIFIPNNNLSAAYCDSPLQIGFGQTISAPHMIAIMLETLEIKADSKVLEIGTGTGYHAAIASKLAINGTVYTIERISELAKKAITNFSELGLTNIKVLEGDGSEGLKAFAPYTHIYSTCAAPAIPKPLISQLQENGKLLIPIGKSFGKLVLMEKNKKEKKQIICGCAFVPMIGKRGYIDD